MDWSVSHSLNHFFYVNDGVEDPVLEYVSLAIILFLGMCLVVAAFARHERGRGVRRTAVAAGISAGLALLIGKIITQFYDRPRPFVAHPHAIHLFLAHAPDASFPSDHALASAAIVTAILLRRYWGWGLFVLVFAAILDFGRVALGLHYPTDVLGGAAIGVLSALVLNLHPLRDWINAISDFVGGIWDRITDPVLGRVASPRRA